MSFRSFVALLLLASSPPLYAEETGPELLARVDQALNDFADGTFDSKLRIKEANGRARELAFVTYQKAPDKRLVRFSSPGDVAGMGVLVESKDTMYVFLPGFQKVRRVGTHVKNQTFMGSDFSFEDMSMNRYSPSYDAKLVKSDEAGWELELTVKPGQPVEFPKLTMWVDKRAMQPTKIDFLDASGKRLRTEEFLEYVQANGRYCPKRVAVTDHRRGGHRSEIEFLDVKYNQGLKDELFNQRSLARGR